MSVDIICPIWFVGTTISELVFLRYVCSLYKTLLFVLLSDNAGARVLGSQMRGNLCYILFVTTNVSLTRRNARLRVSSPSANASWSFAIFQNGASSGPLWACRGRQYEGAEDTRG